MSRYLIVASAVVGLLVGSFSASAQDPDRSSEDKPGAPAPGLRSKKPAFLGVQTSPEPTEPKGALVAEVLPNSPAARAGLRKGDVITRLGDQPIASPPDLIQAVRKAGIGKEVTVTAQRGDQAMKFKAKLEAAPAQLFSGIPPEAFPGGPGLFPRAPQLLDMPDRIRQLQDRIDDLERRLKTLEEQKGKTGAK